MKKIFEEPIIKVVGFEANDSIMTTPDQSTVPNGVVDFGKIQSIYADENKK